MGSACIPDADEVENMVCPHCKETGYRNCKCAEQQKLKERVEEYRKTRCSDCGGRSNLDLTYCMVHGEFCKSVKYCSDKWVGTPR